MLFRNIWAQSLLAAVLVSTGGLACSTPAAAPEPWRRPFETLRGARLYTAGTRALVAGETETAVESLEEAARLAPEASEIQNHLGLAYWAAGQPALAGLAFDRALELDCENAAAQRNREKLAAALSGGPADWAEAARAVPIEEEGSGVE